MPEARGLRRPWLSGVTCSLANPRPPGSIDTASMHASDYSSPRASVTISALGILGCLCRRGGSMRIHALLRCWGPATDDLCDVLKELQERGWIKVRWRTPRGGLPERLREVDRVTMTHEGRLFAPRFCAPNRRKRLVTDARSAPGPSTG